MKNSTNISTEITAEPPDPEGMSIQVRSGGQYCFDQDGHPVQMDTEQVQNPETLVSEE
ncbi:MAG: hypothetical protein AAGU11_21195 [Syntrophobacteraceae bacterium]